MPDNWLTTISGPNYSWQSVSPGATDEQIRALTAFAGHALPPDYVAFLCLAAGAKIRYRGCWVANIWKPENVPAWSSAYGVTGQDIPGAFTFGDDGGTSALVFDFRADHSDGCYPVYAVDFVSVGWEDAQYQAPSLRDLLLAGC